MKIFFLVIVFFAILFIIKSCFPKGGNDFKNVIPMAQKLPNTKIENEKIIIVENADYGTIKKAIEQFCNKYNQENYVAIIQLSKVSNNICALTFPYDIDFGTFSFLVNYLYYPEGISYKANIKAWAYTKSNDEFISSEAVNQYVMLYIPPEDKEYDNVYITTERNVGFVLGFAVGGVRRLVSPREPFINNRYEIKDVKKKPSEIIK